MGIGTSTDLLRRVVLAMGEAEAAWFSEADQKRRKKIEMNLEYLLREAKTWLRGVEDDWRDAFPKVPKKIKYDQKLQGEIFRQLRGRRKSP